MCHISENLEDVESYMLLLLIFSESGYSLCYVFFFPWHFPYKKSLHVFLQTNKWDSDITRVDSQSFLFSSCLNNLGLFLYVLYVLELPLIVAKLLLDKNFRMNFQVSFRLTCDSLFIHKIIYMLLLAMCFFQSLGYRIEKIYNKMRYDISMLTHYKILVFCNISCIGTFKIWYLKILALQRIWNYFCYSC